MSKFPSLISRVTIQKLWGSKDIEFNANPDVNFLIGINGSGKTSVINLIAATLNVDLFTLMNTEFNTISINLVAPEAKSHFTVIVTNLLFHDDSVSKLRYSVQRESELLASAVFDFEYIESRYRYSNFDYSQRNSVIPRFSPIEIQDTMKELVQIRWLPITRSGQDKYQSYEQLPTYNFPIDNRLDKQSELLGELFSSLDKGAESNTFEFQSKIFRSFFQTYPSISDLFNLLQSINLRNEKSSIIEIFEHFKLSKDDYKKSLDNQFTLLETLQSNSRTAETGIEAAEFATLLRMQAVHSVVEEWNNYQVRKEDLYRSKNYFLKIVNSMFSNKVMKINKKNRLVFQTINGKSLEKTTLSSGEKQLLILLSETLLQNQDSWIYIADEPELSLHIGWQHQLVANLRSINSAVQILFATHSPDIVGRFQNKVIKMEEITT